ncbi:MAG TPA: glycosyltransferase family 1 protein [Planctomycetes bacterium]|nr:glycosyltransferase family 1 protein [Planctomycetota bacterium]
MRVGIDYRPALVNREGIGRYARELVRGLIELKFDGNLGLFGYTLSPLRVPREELGIDGTRAELVRLRLPSRALPWMLNRIGRGVDDLVGGCSVYHHTTYSRLRVARAAEVVTIHDCAYLLGADYVSEESAQSMERAARELVAHADRILVPTEFSGAEVVLHLGAFPGQITVTGLGCDHIARRLPADALAPRAPRRDPYLVTVARVDNRKNHLRMLWAFERLVREGLPHRWVIAGPPGHGADSFERALSDSPARERITWKRFVPETELAPLIAGADLFLFASLHEGFGLPPLESMVCGTPVLTSCVAAMPEVCGDAAWFVEPTEEDAIFEGMLRLLREPELRSDLALRGRQRARRFTWKETARKTLAAYRMAAEGKEQPKLRRTL